MNPIRSITPLDALPPQPWRNGGGQTREAFRWPDHDGCDWLRRFSVADIDQDGDFSTFDGVTRCFAVLEGAGVTLHFREPDESITLTPASRPLRFDGARPVRAELLEGSTRDLNWMVRRSDQTGASPLLWLAVPGVDAHRPLGFFNDGPGVLRLDGFDQPLDARQLVVFEAPGPIRARFDSTAVGRPSRAWWWLDPPPAMPAPPVATP